MLRLPRRGRGGRGRKDEELVAAVRAGADLAVIAERHGRTRSAIVSQLLRMIPTREAIVDLVGGVEWHSAELDHRGSADTCSPRATEVLLTWENGPCAAHEPCL
jgi:hypothetical protein